MSALIEQRRDVWNEMHSILTRAERRRGGFLWLKRKPILFTDETERFHALGKQLDALTDRIRAEETS